MEDLDDLSPQEAALVEMVEGDGIGPEFSASLTEAGWHVAVSFQQMPSRKLRRQLFEDMMFAGRAFRATVKGE